MSNPTIDEILEDFAVTVVRDVTAQVYDGAKSDKKEVFAPHKQQLTQLIAEIISPIPDYQGDRKQLIDGVLKNYESYMRLRAKERGIEL